MLQRPPRPAGAQGGNTGFDAGKKVKGRKRHLVVDTLGLALAITVTAASVKDGYDQFSEFDNCERRLIKPLRTLRMVRHSAWLA